MKYTTFVIFVSRFFVCCFVVLLSASVRGQVGGLPVVVVDRDNVEIARSCVVEIGKGVIADGDENGVIHVVADGVTVWFADDGGVLRGAEEGTDWDEVTGIGIMIAGRKHVTIRNARVSWFKVGIYATEADG